MRNLIVLLGFLFFSSVVFAQVINVESLRVKKDTSTWSGFIGFSLGFTKNTLEILELGNDARIQFRKNRHILLFMNNWDLKKVNDASLENTFSQHLRYNLPLSKRIKWEFFIQTQYDELAAIDFRLLVGTGPRIKLTQSKKIRMYLGVLTMYENEKVNSDLEEKRNINIRNSSYLSFSFSPSAQVSMVSTTYFQPLYSDIYDYRILNESILSVRFLKKFTLTLGLKYAFDREPALGITRTQYKVTNGLKYFF